MEAISEKFHHLKFCAKNQWEEYKFRIRHEIRSSGNLGFSAKQIPLYPRFLEKQTEVLVKQDESCLRG